MLFPDFSDCSRPTCSFLFKGKHDFIIAFVPVAAAVVISTPNKLFNK